jgi:hypothetical protein
MYPSSGKCNKPATYKNIQPQCHCTNYVTFAYVPECADRKMSRMSYHRNNPISSRLANTLRLFPKTARLGIYVATSKEEPPQSQWYIDLKPIRWADTFLNSLG